MLIWCVALYLVPFAALVLARSLRDRPAWELALDLPLACALDLVFVLLLSRVVRLETAILVSRPVYVAACVGWCAPRLKAGARLVWPRALGPAQLLAVALGAGLAVWLSLELSRDFMIWDRRWHMPLVPSMTAQRLPFFNVYEPQGVLHYHYAADVHAAILRTLSQSRISAGLALSLSHDIVFGLVGATMALLLVGHGALGFAPAALAGVAVLLHGPFVHHDGAGFEFRAHMYQNYLTDSFRPHTGLAGLLLVGMVGAASVRALDRRKVSLRATVPVLFSTTAVMAITDETSTALVLLGLGAAWLVDADAVAPSRKTGLMVLVGLGATVVVSNLVFAGALAPGGPVQALELVPARIADIRHPPIPLWTPLGLRALGFDLLPLAVPALGLLLGAVVTQSRSLASLAAFAWVVILAATFFATKMRLNHTEGAEAQRFFVAPFFVVLVLALAWLSELPRGSLASVLVVLGAAAPAVLTVFWLRERTPEMMKGSEANHPLLGTNLYAVDCRETAGAGLGDRAEVTYVDESYWYFYTSCRSVFAPGFTDPPWTTKIRPAFETPQHLSELDKMVPRDASVPAICRADGENDRVCRYLKQRTRCERNGSKFVACTLSGADRSTLLGR